jgi:hydrogenase nickel incorporation protein HypB
MIDKHLAGWEGVALASLEYLFIENVGNLVCPSSYDLGEKIRVALLSVTEGEDKPLKYPSIFFKSELMVLTKTDLLPYVPFNVEEAVANARRVHPEMEVVKVACLAGDGMREWMTWLERRKQAFLEELPQPAASR